MASYGLCAADGNDDLIAVGGGGGVGQFALVSYFKSSEPGPSPDLVDARALRRGRTLLV